MMTYYTKDNETVKIEDILDKFTADKCPSLANKPKVFIVQACRGALKDKGHEVDGVCSRKIKQSGSTFNR